MWIVQGWEWSSTISSEMVGVQGPPRPRWGLKGDNTNAENKIRGRQNQTCHFDLTENLNECEEKSECAKKNLNLTTKIALLYIEISTKFKAKKI